MESNRRSVLLAAGTAVLPLLIATASMAEMIRKPLTPGRDAMQLIAPAEPDVQTMLALPDRGMPRTSPKAAALQVLTQAQSRAVGPRAILLVNTNTTELNIQVRREGNWQTILLTAFEIEEVACTDCGEKVQLRFDDTRQVQVVDFDAGTRVAIVWSAALGRFQAMALPQAQTFLRNAP